MSPQDLGLLLGVFFTTSLTLGFFMDRFEKKKPGAGTPGQRNRK